MRGTVIRNQYFLRVTLLAWLGCATTAFAQGDNQATQFSPPPLATPKLEPPAGVGAGSTVLHPSFGVGKIESRLHNDERLYVRFEAPWAGLRLLDEGSFKILKPSSSALPLKLNRDPRAREDRGSLFLNDTIEHKDFGRGLVLGRYADGDYKVRFGIVGEKKIKDGDFSRTYPSLHPEERTRSLPPFVMSCDTRLQTL